MKALLEKLRYWKWLIYLGILIVLVFVARYFIKRIGQSNKDKDLERLIIGHFEGQIRTAKEHIKASEERRKRLKDKYSKLIKVLIFCLLFPCLLRAEFILNIDGEWRNFDTSTNAVDYLMQERGAFLFEIDHYNHIITAQSNEIYFLKEINKKDKPSSFFTYVYPWIPPLLVLAILKLGFDLRK